MRVLITGATGFIGRRIASALHARGHDVIGCARRRGEAARRWPEYGWVRVDFNRDLDPHVWRPRLYAIDAVVNCAGILRETAGNPFEVVHALGPQTLFEACARAGVRRVIHFSALGTESRARSLFIASKRFADNFLELQDLDWTVLAPALVFGPGGAASELLLRIARLPVIPLVDTRGARIAPVHADDVTDAVVRLLEPEAPVRTRIAAVGPEAMPLAEYLARLRRALGLGRARFAPLPDWLVAVPAWAAELRGAGFFGREALALLRTDLAADPGPFAALVGRALRPVATFLTPPATAASGLAPATGA